MNIADINRRVNFYTNTDTTEYEAEDRLIATNKAVDDTHIMILQAMDGDDFDDKNYTDNFPIKPTDIVSGQSDYSLPSDLVKIKRVTISYDGNNIYKATPFDINQSGVALKDSYFNVQSPFYDLHDNSIEIYPEPTQDVTNGLQIWISRQMALFTSAEVTTGTKEPGFDRQFHEIIPLKVSYDWVLAKTPEDSNKLTSLGNKIAEYEQRIKQHYSDKQKDDNMTIVAGTIDYDTGKGNINGRN